MTDRTASDSNNREQTSSLLHGCAALLLLVILPAIVYSNSLSGPFIFDDSRIYNNPHIRLVSLSPESLKVAALESEPRTRPVVNLTFGLNYYFQQYNVTGYHAVNLLIHIFTGVLLYFFIRTTLSLPILENRYGPGRWLPLAATLLWSLHPIQTQSVTYIIQRMNSMAAMFYLLAMLCYVRGRLQHEAWRKWLLFAGSLAAGLLALGSKEMAATLPFFILLYEWYFFQDLRPVWLRKRFFYLVAAVALLAGLSYLYLGDQPLAALLGRYDTREFTLLQRVLTEFRVVVFYFSLLLFPHPSRLNFDHHFLLSDSVIAPSATLAAVVIVGGLFGLAVYLARRERLLSFCILWFFGNIIIESSVVGLEIIFEHRNYLPSMLLLLLAVLLADRLLRGAKLKMAVLLSVLLLFSAWTYERNFVWSDRITFWSDCAEKSPNKARPHNNLGVALKVQGRLAEAAEHYLATIRLDPGFTEAYYNLANILKLQGRLDEAIQYYRRAVRLAPDNAQVRNSLGNTLYDAWRLEEAMAEYGEALRLNPGLMDARINLQKVRQLILMQQRTAPPAPLAQ